MFSEIIPLNDPITGPKNVLPPKSSNVLQNCSPNVNIFSQKRSPKIASKLSPQMTSAKTVPPNALSVLLSIPICPQSPHPSPQMPIHAPTSAPSLLTLPGLGVGGPGPARQGAGRGGERGVRTSPARSRAPSPGPTAKDVAAHKHSCFMASRAAGSAQPQGSRGGAGAARAPARPSRSVVPKPAPPPLPVAPPHGAG